jgi:hypothetical protein
VLSGGQGDRGVFCTAETLVVVRLVGMDVVKMSSVPKERLKKSESISVFPLLGGASMKWCAPYFWTKGDWSFSVE